MKWKKYTINTTTAAEDLISEMLSELGIEGVQIEDNIQLSEEDTKAMFVDFLPELPPDEGKAKVSFFLEESEDGIVYPVGISGEEDLFMKVKNALNEVAAFVDTGDGTISTDETEDKDWINNWKQYFKPFKVDDIVIKPTWEEVPSDMTGRMVVDIDPGTAFGTGSHETTQLVIRQMAKYMKEGDNLLDVGTGSGILSVIGLKLGACHALGTDLDKNAIVATAENMDANNITADMYEVIEGNIIDDSKIQDFCGYDKYDIVTANILADILIPMLPQLHKHMKKGAYLIMSGIIDFKEEPIKKAINEAGAYEICETNYQGEWVSVTVRKK